MPFLTGIIGWAVGGQITVGHLDVGPNDMLGIPESVRRAVGWRGSIFSTTSIRAVPMAIECGCTPMRWICTASWVHPGGSDEVVCGVRAHPEPVSFEILQIELAVISQDGKSVVTGRLGEHP